MVIRGEISEKNDLRSSYTPEASPLYYLQKTNFMHTPPKKIEYPHSKRLPINDNYHGTIVNDPYRWLEDDTAPEVEDWVKRQNEVTFDYLEKKFQ